MKLKTIMVRVDGPGNQEQIGQFEQLFDKFVADPNHNIAFEHTRTFVLPVGQTQSVYMVAHIAYLDAAALTSAL